MSMNVVRILVKDQAVFVLTESTILNVYVRREELDAPVNEVICFSALRFKNQSCQRIPTQLHHFQIKLQSVTEKLIL